MSRRGGVRKDRRIQEDGDAVLLPLTGAGETMAKELGLEVVEGELRERTCYRSPYELVLDQVDLPPDLKNLLPRRWERVGDIVLLKLPAALEGEKADIAAAYARVLGARTVVRDLGHISGTFRTPEVELLYGEGTETIHYENGIYYKLDVAKLMFSSGNIDEKLRMAALDCRGETVVDMFAGIGYFTLPLAVHARAKEVIACEINPLAHRYLVENVALNRVQGIVRPWLGNNMDLPGEGFADRVVMGYVRTTAAHLGKAFRLVRRGGTIHYHDTFPLEIFPSQALKNVERASGGRRYDVRLLREVKSYSPGVSHMVVDIKVLD